MSNQSDLNILSPAAANAALGDKLNEIILLVNELRTQFLVHTHHADGSQAAGYATTKPTTDAPTVTGGTAMTVTNAAVPSLG